jgi:hypothetical protein
MLRTVRRRCGNNVLIILGALALIASILVLSAPLRSWLHQHVPFGGAYFREIVALVAAATIGASIYHHCSDRVVRRGVRQEMTRCGYPTCVKCGYDLTGLDDARCPECGTDFDPALLRQRSDDDAVA